MDAIVAYDLSKDYGGVPALRSLNLQVPAGQAFACVGGRNSGKTTLIRLLSGLCRPSAGECTVLGLSPYFEPEKLHAAVGTVLDSARLYEYMTLSENLRFFSGIDGIEENDAVERISFLLHKLDIWEGRDMRIDDLPTGAVRRASLARALLHSPQVLLMDAPSTGLDRETTESIQDLISHLVSQEGMAVLLCTQDTAYAQLLCDSFAILKDGAILAKGNYDSLYKSAGTRCQAVLRLKEGDKPPKGFKWADGFWKKQVDSELEMPRIISQVILDGGSLYEARVLRPTLEEIYNAILEGGIRKVGESDEQDDEYEELHESGLGDGADLFQGDSAAAEGFPEPDLSAAGLSEADLPEAGEEEWGAASGEITGE